MHSEVSKRINIQKEINLIPENKLDDVKTYVETILIQADINKPEPVTLKGIWKGCGLEQIIDNDSEIMKLRKNLSDSLMNIKI